MKREHAIVIGGGNAGLRAGIALAAHFQSVAIIEKEHVARRENLPLLLSLPKLPNIRIRENCTVTGLIPSVDNQSIQGVLALSKDTDILKLRHADFIIDASGKSSRSANWLIGLGYGEVEEQSAGAFSRRRYENMSHWPDRFVVLGDALCSVSKSEGNNLCSQQIAALELAFRKSSNISGIAESLQKEFAEFISMPWKIASGDWSDALLNPKMWWGILKKATGFSGFAGQNP